MARRAAVLDAQPSLFDDPAPAAPAEPAPATSKTKKRLRNHVLGLPRPWPKHMFCTMSCLVCRRPEDMGVCAAGCAVVCGRPDKTGPVEVCLLTLVLPARLIGRYAAVSCPHCDHTHWHQPRPGRRYRVGQCGQPYIVHPTERSIP